VIEFYLGIGLLIFFLAIVVSFVLLISALAKLIIFRNRTKPLPFQPPPSPFHRSEDYPLHAPHPQKDPRHHTNSDRWFPNPMLVEGRRLAGNRCEHTDTRVNERCKNYWQEGDHFYDYGKGGATSQRNLVGACKWHNNPTSRTLKARSPEAEKLVIQERRKSYFPQGADISIGEWRNTGLRITFSVKNRVHRLESVDPDELVTQIKEVLHYYAGPKAVTAKLDSISTFGQMFDYLWSMRSKGTFVDNLEGIDPLYGKWVSLRKPSAWAKENPGGNR
jgi:hypothetical protein